MTVGGAATAALAASSQTGGTAASTSQTGGTTASSLGSASAADSSGGTSAGPRSPSDGSGAGAPAPSAPTSGTLTGSPAMELPTAALEGQVLRVRGQLGPRSAHVLVIIQRLDQSRGWLRVARARVRRNGSYVVSWRPHVAGSVMLRALVGRPHSAALIAAPSATVMVYRPAGATWYGPGFYGDLTACGEVLTPTTLGVANRTLPCGTLVTLWYQGTSITVPVIDRGPYGPGVDWDLTAFTAQSLGMTDTSEIGVLVQD